MGEKDVVCLADITIPQREAIHLTNIISQLIIQLEVCGPGAIERACRDAMDYPDEEVQRLLDAIRRAARAFQGEPV